MEDPIQRYRTKSSDRHRRRRKSFQSIERLQKEVYKTQQTISSTDDKKVHKSSRAAGHSQSKSKSRASRACPFDEHGYCRMHPDVRLAKKKAGGGWIVLQGTCHKCLRRRPSPSTESLTDDSYQEQSKKRSEHRARSSSRGRRRGAANEDKSSATQRSRSKSIRARSKSLSKRIKGSRLVCVDGAPFDKSGRCFVHNHVKLASKKLLGGWKIHYPFCPECAKKDDLYEENCSVISGISGFSRGSFASRHDDYSVASSAYHSRGDGGRGDSSVRSSRSYKSSGSVATWSSKQSRKRMDKKDGSFLPLDADGYCLHHPEVQLAEVDRKGGWNVLLDFCPECAQETLIIGGPVPGPRKSRHHQSSRSSVSSRSTRSVKSAESAGTFVDKMPYIDGEGQTGYYTGHVNGDGRPTGRGKMKYKNGSKFEGVWDEGTKIHGKTTQSKGKTDTIASKHRQRSKSNHRHSKKNEPRCQEQSRKSGGSRSRIRNER